MPAAVVLAPLAFIIANLLIYWSGFEVLWKLGICIVIGYVLIGISMAFDPQRPPLDWKSAQWLPVYLIGMGIISWQGQFSGGAVQAPAAADQHRQHPVLVGHAGGRRRSAWSSTSGRGHQAAAGGDARAGQQAGRRSGRTAARRCTALSPRRNTVSDPVARRGPARLARGVTPAPRHKDAGRALRAAAGRGRPVADQHPAHDQRPGTGPKRRAVHRARAPGCPTRATSRRRLAPGRALDEQQARAAPDARRARPGRGGSGGCGAGEQPVARAQGGLHGLLGDRDPRWPAHASLRAAVHV